MYWVVWREDWKRRERRSVRRVWVRLVFDLCRVGQAGMRGNRMERLEGAYGRIGGRQDLES